eukprot:TRINITY_DN11448_c0_g1_i1.p1 TRINITY_DN11448_c0_g1~~TRINITY_DN11448_c0_g1_i1.p1  ORF type:complete len:473 (-),score=119.10 TRINITY_DN11448_c0_g1_i1:23-1327(-)
MAQYDLTHTMAPYIDLHLLIPIFEFLEKKEIYKEEDILKEKIRLLLERTNMIDFAAELYQQVYNKPMPAEMMTKRDEVVNQLEQFAKECGTLANLVDDEQLVAKLRAEKLFTVQYLQENYQITAEQVDALYRFAKFKFDCGDYKGAYNYLSCFRLLNTNPEKNLKATWGHLAAAIWQGNYDEGLKDIQTLRELIDSKNQPPLKQLQQRTWLIHWSLFVFFNHQNGRNAIIDLFFSERYLNTIQTSCPHILRYLTAAVITNKRRRNVLKDLVKVIQQESYTYRDPITEFLEALYVNFDFEGAQLKLRECDKVLVNDYFLIGWRNEFIENARLFIFETYCRIHQCIDISMLAEKLNMDSEAAEKWIVNLIRNAKLDAKIDSQKNTVIMGSQYSSIYQKVIEKTKGLSFRSYVLADNLAKESVGATLMDDDEIEGDN